VASLQVRLVQAASIVAILALLHAPVSQAALGQYSYVYGSNGNLCGLWCYMHAQQAVMDGVTTFPANSQWAPQYHPEYGGANTPQSDYFCRWTTMGGWLRKEWHF